MCQLCRAGCHFPRRLTPSRTDAGRESRSCPEISCRVFGFWYPLCCSAGPPPGPCVRKFCLSDVLRRQFATQIFEDLASGFSHELGSLLTFLFAGLAEAAPSREDYAITQTQQPPEEVVEHADKDAPKSDEDQDAAAVTDEKGHSMLSSRELSSKGRVG